MPSRLRLLLAAAAAVLLVAEPSPAGAVTDSRLPEQWGLAAIGAPAAWSAGTGNGITIAVVDTGADFGHEDLRSKLLPGRNFVDPGKSAQDDNGHGTHVAGIAAAATNNGVGVAGTAPGARILPVKVLDADGSGSVGDISEGITWAAANGAHVINLSLGPNAVVASLLGSGLEDAVNEAWNKGSVVVIAAGNDFLFSSSYSTVNAVVVTATTREDRHAVYASGVGSAKWGISAPGGAGTSRKADDILSTHWKEGSPNHYEFLAGTSMATPYVAGAAAVLRGRGLSPQETVDRLLATAKDLGRAGRDTTYGAGRLDMGAAVGGALAPPPLPPPTTPPARAASPSPPPVKVRPAPAPPSTTPAPAPAAQPTTTAPAPGGGAAVPPGADPSSTAVSDAQLAVPSPADRKRGPVGTEGGGNDRPWIPIGGAALALTGSAVGVLWVQRNSRWA